jgi:polar amino acid transport system permease protein
MDFSVVFDNWRFLFDGVKVTVEIALAATAGGMFLGLVAAICRLAGGRIINGIVKLYVDFFRTVPLAIQLIWIYFALPIFLNASIPRFLAAAVAFSLYEGAFFTEIFRAGILSLPRGQRYAAAALGMRKDQVYRRIILPQAVTRMLPVLASQLVFLLKDTSVVFVIQVGDLTYNSQTLGTQSLQPLPVLTAALIIYVALTYPITVAANVAYSRLRR